MPTTNKKQQQEIKLSRLRAEIERGYHQMEKGEYSDRSIDDIARTVRRESEA